MAVLILPTSEKMVRHLRHPDKDARTFVDIKTPIEWPLDQFTIRRLRDGDIVMAEAKEKE